MKKDGQENHKAHKPGPHPDRKHQWNKNQSKFVKMWIKLEEDNMAIEDDD